MSSEAAPKTVLLVEDNPDDVFLMRRIFQKDKIPALLEVVTDGKKAVDYLGATTQSGNAASVILPNLVFLDLKLPYLNGFDVLRWIRQQPNLAALSVVVLSSSLEDQDRERAELLGAPYFVKPPTAQMVHEALQFIKG